MMGLPLERRGGQGRRRGDARDTLAVRGLLHDLGHEITTLSYLVEAARGDVSLPGDSAGRLELLSMEMSRLLAIVQQGLSAMDSPGGAEPVEVRAMATQIGRLAALAHEADVTMAPGPEVIAEVNSILLWRVLSNVVDNAARAAGPGGAVTVTVRHDDAAIIEVADDGPGFGAGPPGMASLGLEVVTSLLNACGGSLEVATRPAGGAMVRVLLPGRVPVLAAGQRSGRAR